jgi:hypothetical protein
MMTITGVVEVEAAMATHCYCTMGMYNVMVKGHVSLWHKHNIHTTSALWPLMHAGQPCSMHP